VREDVTYHGDSDSWRSAMSTAPALQNVWGWQPAVTLLLGPRQWRPGPAEMSTARCGGLAGQKRRYSVTVSVWLVQLSFELKNPHQSILVTLALEAW